MLICFAAGFLSRIFMLNNDIAIKDIAIDAVKYSISDQNEDGSWKYGSASSQTFIDSFHTGFNLEQLHIFSTNIKDLDLDLLLEKGQRFYFEEFFHKDGTPKYYHNSTYPIDAHCPAQFLSYCGLKNLKNEFTEKVLARSIELLVPNSHTVYYQKYRAFTNKIQYMRWSLIWMAYGLAKYYENDLD